MLKNKSDLVLFIYPGYENLGIEYLSSSLKNNGFETDLIIDPVLFNEAGFIRNKTLGKFFDKTGAIVDQIVSRNPILVAISVVTDNWYWAKKIIEAVKSKSDIPIIIGGVHPTILYDEILLNTDVDYVCIGEGDDAIVELCENLKAKNNIDGICNIALKKEGKLKINVIRPPKKMDSLPVIPDKELFYKKYPFLKKGYLISSSRGCPYKCSYCNNNFYHKLYEGKGFYYRKRSVDHVIKELETAKKKYSPDYFHFIDESFNADEEWLFEFLSIYKKYIKMPFSCYIFPKKIDEKMVRLLSEAGCFKIQFGLQTSNVKIREKLFYRYTFNDDIANLISFSKKYNIYSVSDTILGIPGENEDSLYHTAKFYIENTPDQIEVFALKFYPETAITKNNNIEGLEDEKNGIAVDNSSLTTFERKMAVFLSLIPIMPRKVSGIITKGKMICLVPVLPLLFLIVFKRLFKRTKFDINAVSTIKRYLHEIFKLQF